MIIAGDIGGTKTNVAMFEIHDQGIGNVVALESFPSSGYASLEEIVSSFVSKYRQHPVTHACFGVAGPVVDGRVETTNLKWVVSGASLAGVLNLDHVGLINDLEATAHGIDELHSSNLYVLNEGAGSRNGHRALIAAGTGLGMTIIFWDGQLYRPMAGEGGHVDFAPRNELEIELLRYVTEKLGGHVSYERVLSGMGINNIYSFLRDRNVAEEPEWLAEEMKAGDPVAAISRAGMARRSELAVKTLDLLVEIYGAMAGNLALMANTVGGLFVGGGIAPKILDKLKEGSFMRAFKDKGRMSFLAESVPVRVILDDKTALYGAARCALFRAR